VTVAERFSLAGKVAIVTGASSGLGRCFAGSLAEAGADLVIGARRKEQLEETERIVTAAGGRCHSVVADIAKREDCDRLAAAAVAEFGHLDVLVNNAGTGTPAPALQEDPDEFTRVIAVNLLGVHWMSLAAAERMSPGSSIVNISSILALTTAGIPQAAYAAAKAGVMGLTRDLAHQWSARKGIRVNAILPGFFETEMTAPHGRMDAMMQRTALRRLGRPEDLIGPLLLLASEAGGYMTGQEVVVDGGFTTG
jgi:NAD(P)-dependent dehydrogenase (short-subunit alcohol dehydrogenase family)